MTSIDGLEPLAVLQPQSVPELGELVRRAAADGQAVYPLGGMTMLHVGLPPTKPGLAVDLRRLDQVIDYPARDMTITVGAGITIARLQEILARENQQLPIDVPLPESATLGGALATNASGPRRYGHGTLRDYVIGISVVNDEGQEVKAGGRVVKNVAGYDLCKLYIGALGTLGIITQVTLKLRPRPEAQRWLTVPCPAEDLPRLVEHVQGSRARPTIMELLNRNAVEDIGRRLDPSVDFGSSLPDNWWRLALAFEGSPTTLDWQVRHLQEELPASIRLLSLELVDTDAAALHALLADYPLRPEVPLTFKATLVPRSVAEFSRHVLLLDPEVSLQVHAGNGIVFGHLAGAAALEKTQALLRQLQEWAAAGQGNVTLPRCPQEWKKALPIWGIPRGDAWLMRAIKDKLDPKRTFNPGRFVEGI